jgi:hypothetical protein
MLSSLERHDPAPRPVDQKISDLPQFLAQTFDAGLDAQLVTSDQQKPPAEPQVFPGGRQTLLGRRSPLLEVDDRLWEITLGNPARQTNGFNPTAESLQPLVTPGQNRQTTSGLDSVPTIEFEHRVA